MGVPAGKTSGDCGSWLTENDCPATGTTRSLPANGGTAAIGCRQGVGWPMSIIANCSSGTERSATAMTYSEMSRL